MFQRKQQLSSFDVAVVSKELDGELRGYYIDNIYQTAPVTLLLKLNKPGLPVKQLVVESGRRIHTTKYVVEKPAKPSMFVSALRKYLLNSRIQGVEQPDFERIVTLRVSTSTGSYILIVELFGKGNVVLTDGDGVVLHALSYRRMKDRRITRGERLVYPPPAGLDPEKITLGDFSTKLRQSRVEVVKALTRSLGVSGVYAEEFLLSAGVEKTLPADKLTGEMEEKVYRAFTETYAKTRNPQPVVVFDDSGEPVDVAPFMLLVYSKCRFERYPTLNEALDEYFAMVVHEEKVRKERSHVELHIRELERIFQEQSGKLRELEERENRNRVIGDVIFKFAGELQGLTQWVKDRKQTGLGWHEVEQEIMSKRSTGEIPFTYFTSVNPKVPSVRVMLNDVEFDLDLKKTIYENASSYYDESKRFRKKISSLKRVIEETTSKLKMTQERVGLAEKEVGKPVRAGEKKWFEKYRFFFSSEGFLVVSGKDAYSNEALVKRYTEAGDIVFHAEMVGAPFTVVKTEGKTPTQITLQEAAQFTACHSRAWRDGFASGDVYYVKREQVSKSAPSGQYLVRGAFTVSGQRNYIRNVPLSLAFGVKVDDGIQVLAGPVTAVEAATKYHVEVVPGEECAKDVAAQVRLGLSKLLPKEKGEEARRIPLERFSTLIPYGKARVASRFTSAR